MATLPNTTFANELKLFFNCLDGITNVRYVGNCVYANITNEILLKAEFRTLFTSSKYEIIRISAIKKTRGEIDHVDIMLPMTSTPYGSSCRKYLSVSDDGRLSWYSKPDPKEIGEIRAQITDYFTFFK